MNVNITIRLYVLITLVTFIVSCQPDDPKIASFNGGDVLQSEYIELYLASTERKPNQLPDEPNLKN